MRLAVVVSRSRDQDGMTLVELMVALMILAVAIFALSFLLGQTIVGTLHTREREVGVALANQQIESARSIGYGNLAMQSGPSSYLDDDGKTYTTLISSGCTTCIPYTQSVTQGGFTFTVKTIVMQIDDPADGTGASDSDHQTVDYKRVAVEVSSVDPPPFTYKSETIVHNTTTDPVVPVQGIRVEIHDSTGAIVTDDSFDWTITVTGAGIQDQPVDEGVFQNYALAVGAYSCQVSNTADTQDWYPQGGAAGDTTDTFACSVTAGQITTYARTWNQQVQCTATAGATGRLWVHVDGESGPLSGASVDPTPTQGQTPDPPSATTGANGDAIFDGIPVGDYTVSISATSYQTQTGLDACVFSQDPDDPQVSVTMVHPGTSAQVTVNVTYTGGGTKTFQVALENGPQPYSSQQSITKNQTVAYAFTPAFGTYTVTVYCQKGTNFNKKDQKTGQSFVVASPAYTLSFTEKSC